MIGAMHIEQWLQRAEPDYYAAFINAWIPFNAWYVHEYQETQDKACLDKICSTNNKYRLKIKTLLKGDTDESKEFLHNLSRLHYELLSHPIPGDNPINLDNVLKEENPNTVFQKDFRKYSYKWEYFKQVKPHCKCVVSHKDAFQTTLCTIDLTQWNVEELEADQNFQNLDEIIRGKIREYLNEIKPFLNVQIVIHTPISKMQLRNAKEIDADKKLYVINDIDKVSCAIVWLIYKLRCLIFHGNIGPTKDSSNIYKYAYYIQRALIKALV